MNEEEELSTRYLKLNLPALVNEALKVAPGARSCKPELLLYSLIDPS